MRPLPVFAWGLEACASFAPAVAAFLFSSERLRFLRVKSLCSLRDLLLAMDSGPAPVFFAEGFLGSFFSSSWFLDFAAGLGLRLGLFFLRTRFRRTFLMIWVWYLGSLDLLSEGGASLKVRKCRETSSSMWKFCLFSQVPSLRLPRFAVFSVKIVRLLPFLHDRGLQRDADLVRLALRPAGAGVLWRVFGALFLDHGLLLV